MSHALYALSPIDGRYSEKTQMLSPYASEAALMKYRLIIEIEWLIFLSEQTEIIEITAFTDQQKLRLRLIASQFSTEDALEVKTLEKTTQHTLPHTEQLSANCCALYKSFLLTQGDQASSMAEQ